LISIGNARLDSRAPLASLFRQLRRHRALTRTLIAGLSIAVAAAVSAGTAAQAGLPAVKPAPPSILPIYVGIGIGTDEPVSITFPSAMDRASVESGLAVVPAHPIRVLWSDDGRRLQVFPQELWSTDMRYLLAVPSSARTASGALVGGPARFSFTTQTAPTITDFEVHFVAEPAGGAAALRLGASEAVGPPPDIASDVSAATSIQITFSAAMNASEVKQGFLLTPSLPGIFRTTSNTMTFTPFKRFASDARYTVALAGVHDRAGNALAGDTSFSFTTRPGSQLVQSTPKAGATSVTGQDVLLWFSQPVDDRSVAAALRVSDRSSGAALTGKVVWNRSHTQLRFTPTRPLAAGHGFDVTLVGGAKDADGNPVTVSLTFTTEPAVVHRTALAPHAGPSSTLVGYALNQVNAARAAYGLRPLVLSSAISAVANAHAWDMLRNNYFSHTSLDGRTREDRLRNAGISFGWSGENICFSYNSARSPTNVLNWCQSQFMSEPYPGYANHIGNILGAHYTRIGIGIAVSGSKVYIVWDFTD
jgi:uncharacterized protein YkwD